MENENSRKPKFKAKHAKQLEKTQLCKFFRARRCTKGDQCEFAHSVDELREKPDLNRTGMCKAFLHSGSCEDPQCKFAHCEGDLRTTSSFYKSKLCRFASRGRCKHGERCRYAHGNEELNMEGLEDWTEARDNGAQASDLPGPSETNSDSLPGPSSKDQNNFADEYGAANFDCSAHSGSAASHVPTSDGCETSGTATFDYSTRAGSTASHVPTTEGSEESGPEESPRSSVQRPTSSMECGRRANYDWRDRRGGDYQERGGRHAKTVVLASLPRFLTQGAVLNLLEDLTPDMRGACDFFYCPWDSHHGQNLGFAIINFFNRAIARECVRFWTHTALVPRTKPLRAVPAAVQGRAANIRHFSDFSMARHPNPRFRPLVRSTPDEEFRPMAVGDELTCNNGSDNPRIPAHGQDSWLTQQHWHAPPPPGGLCQAEAPTQAHQQPQAQRQAERQGQRQAQQRAQAQATAQAQAQAQAQAHAQQPQMQPRWLHAPHDADWKAEVLRQQAAQVSGWWPSPNDNMYLQQPHVGFGDMVGTSVGVPGMHSVQGMAQPGFAPVGAELAFDATAAQLANEHTPAQPRFDSVGAELVFGARSPKLVREHTRLPQPCGSRPVEQFVPPKLSHEHSPSQPSDDSAKLDSGAHTPTLETEHSLSQPCLISHPKGAELGSGAQTPERENEHPLSHMLVAQFSTEQRTGMFGTWSPDQTTHTLIQAAAQLNSWQQYQGQEGSLPR